jgi:hypothetical protein
MTSLMASAPTGIRNPVLGPGTLPGVSEGYLESKKQSLSGDLFDGDLCEDEIRSSSHDPGGLQLEMPLRGSDCNQITNWIG